MYVSLMPSQGRRGLASFDLLIEPVRLTISAWDPGISKIIKSINDSFSSSSDFHVCLDDFLKMQSCHYKKFSPVPYRGIVRVLSQRYPTIRVYTSN